MVRHRILVPIFVGSNPTSPVCNMINIAKFSFFIQLSLRSSSPTGLIKGASNVPDGNPRKNEVLYLVMTFVAAGGKEPQQ